MQRFEKKISVDSNKNKEISGDAVAALIYAASIKERIFFVLR